MSYYVKRIKADGVASWVGPIRSPKQAEREREAWESVGRPATVHASTPEIRAAVRAWERAKRDRGQFTSRY